MTESCWDLPKKVEKAITRWELLSPGEGLLCAVSGGADSMCLLTLLRELGYAVTAAHFNHQLRGGASQGDADFVRSWCQGRDIPLVCGQGDVRAAAKTNGWTLEEAGRTLRLAFLEETAQTLRLARIATAHHAGDNAETVLMHLVRGSGLRGLGGIAPLRPPYIRPLITAERGEIEDYLRQRAIPWVEDGSNADTALTRNRFRHEIMPLLAAENPRLLAQMGEQTEVFRREDALLDALAAAHLQGVVRSPGKISLPLRAVEEAAEALRPRMLRLLLAELGGLRDISRRHLEALVALALHGSEGKQLSLPGGLLGRRERAQLWLSCQETAPKPLVLYEGTAGDWGAYTVHCEKKTKENSQRGHTISFCYDKIDWPLTIDLWTRDGGMTLHRGRRSLKRLLSDAGIPAHRRQEVAVVYMGGESVAALGLGVEESLRPVPGGEILVLRFQLKKEKSR